MYCRWAFSFYPQTIKMPWIALATLYILTPTETSDLHLPVHLSNGSMDANVSHMDITKVLTFIHNATNYIRNCSFRLLKSINGDCSHIWRHYYLCDDWLNTNEQKIQRKNRTKEKRTKKCVHRWIIIESVVK